jgi:hypothetical protein
MCNTYILPHAITRSIHASDGIDDVISSSRASRASRASAPCARVATLGRRSALRVDDDDDAVWYARARDGRRWNDVCVDDDAGDDDERDVDVGVVGGVVVGGVSSVAHDEGE